MVASPTIHAGKYSICLGICPVSHKRDHTRKDKEGHNQEGTRSEDGRSYMAFSSHGFSRPLATPHLQPIIRPHRTLPPRSESPQAPTSNLLAALRPATPQAERGMATWADRSVANWRFMSCAFQEIHGHSTTEWDRLSSCL